MYCCAYIKVCIWWELMEFLKRKPGWFSLYVWDWPSISKDFFFFISASLMSLTTSFWVTAKHLPALKSGTWMHYLQCKRLACSRQDFIPGGTEDITESCIFVEMIKLQLQPQLQKLTLRRQMSSWKHEGKKYSTRKLCPAQKNICLAEG